MKLVVLDGYTVNPGDLSWEGFQNMGELKVYETSTREEALERAKDADAIFVNAVGVDRAFMESCPKLKYIGLLCTGYNHIDLIAAAEKGIAVTNIPLYASDAVAQHAIALLLELTNQVALHNAAVQNGEWFDIPYDCFWKQPLTLLAGKTLGIIGYGAIGKRVAQIAEALGMKINIFSKDPEAVIQSDFLSLHCPLTAENREMINAEFISKMKDGAVIINTARGGLINEQDLANALKSGKIKAAGLDVVSVEPPHRDCENPLFGLPNCIITPHNAWVPAETRENLLKIAVNNLQNFLEGGKLNRREG